MKRFYFWVIVLFTMIFCSLGSLAWSSTSEKPIRPKEIIIAGSGVNLGITRLLAKGFAKEHPQIRIDIPGSIGTKGGILASVDGVIELGLISRSLREEEVALGLAAQAYARVAIIIGANPSVPDASITSLELIDIFRGTKTTWNSGHEIIVQARAKSDSGFLVLQNHIPGFREVYKESQEAKRWTLYFTDQDANRALEKTPFAIGVSDLGMINTEDLRIKVLSLDSVAPTSENLHNGSYPLTRKLSFVYRVGHLSEEAQSFMTFVYSKEGSDILKSNGYLPVD